MLKCLLHQPCIFITASTVGFFAASTEIVMGGELLPYRGNAEGRVVSRDYLDNADPIPFGPAFCRVAAIALGNFTHVGRSTVEVSYDMSVIVENNIIYLIGNGSYVLTAANGDRLSGPIHTVQNFFTGEFTVESSITEGTGRFDGATGIMDGFGMLFMETDTFEYALEGVITIVDSPKKKQ